jgi:signal transduction histidine kinase/putative methionine-R-sulfoxide reductase with GAF domain
MKKISRRTKDAARRAIPANADPPEALSTSAAAEDRVRELEEQLRAMGAIGASMATTVGLDALFKELVPNLSRLMRAERSTLFVYDEKTREIWSKVAQGHSLTEIRLKLGQGIAGWAAEHREPVNIKNAYADSRFNPEVDLRSGFKTRSVAAAPLIDRQGRLLGVLQVLNREGGPFGEHDIGLLNFLAVGTSYAVENANLTQEVLDRNRELEAATHRAERRSAELDLLYQLEQESAASSDLEATLSSIIARACERLRSEGGAVLLLQDQQATLFHLDLAGAEDRTRPLLHRRLVDPEAGVIGWVAKTGEPLISNALDEDPRYDLSASDDPQVKAVLAVPLVWDHRVIGAVRVHTPSSRPGESHGGYDLADLKVLTLIAGQVARGVSLAQARKEQLDTERLAAMGQMLAGVAHDLRNPMMVISGFAQIMADELDGSQRHRRCERILSQIDEMTTMIGDLLAFARGDRVLHPAIIDLEVFVQDIEETLGAQCGPRSIELVIQAEGGTIFVDVSRAKRILYNLTKNAVDALNRGGRLAVSLAVDGGGLRLRVEDTGPGMSSEVRARLFDPFFTAGKRHGTGLGLSIVKRFVDDHHGKIEVESTLGKGTVFTVFLPRPKPEAEGQSRTAP